MLTLALLNGHMPGYDAELQLELAEHALLIGNGWYWSVIEKVGHHTSEVMWVAPPHHKGSQRVYESRAHAINSHKRWNMGLGSLANKNPRQRLKERTSRED
jgi:hypothetical protein